MRYRIKYTDSSWLWLTPLAFLNMGGSDHYEIQSKKHWWNKWEKVGYTYDNQTDAYIEYFKLKYNINIQKKIEWNYSKKYGFYKNYAELKFEYRNNNLYQVGYIRKNPCPEKYIYHVISNISFEDALIRLYNDMKIRELIKE